MRDEYVLKKISQLLDEHNWTLYRLAKEARISYSTLSNTFHRNNVPSVTTLLRICKGFDITMSEFFDEGGTDFTQLDTSDQQLLRDFRQLPRADKALVTAYMRGLAHNPNDENNEYEKKDQTKEQA